MRIDDISSFIRHVAVFKDSRSMRLVYSRLSLSRLRLSRITAYLEEKI